MIDSLELLALGVPPALATEVGRQVSNGVGEAPRLVMAGLQELAAKELAAQINSGAFDGNRLVSSGLIPEIAAFIMKMTPAAPVNVAAPSITGTATVGQTLNGNNGTWSGATPMTAAYRWQRSSDNGATWADIAGATAASYVLAGADEGKVVRRGVQMTNSVGASDWANSVASAVVEAATGDLAFDGLPTFVQPDGDGGWEAADPTTTNEDVQIHVPGVSGGVPPYAYEFALYDDSDDSVIVARDSGQEVDTGDLEGKTIYARVWAIDAASTEIHADSLPWGPVVTPSASFVWRVSFLAKRTDLAELEREPDVFYALNDDPDNSDWSDQIFGTYPDVDGIADDETDYGTCGQGSVAMTITARTSSPADGARMRGTIGSSTLLNRQATFTVPNGNYRLKGACANYGFATNERIQIIDGTQSDGIVIYDSPSDGVPSAGGNVLAFSGGDTPSLVEVGKNVAAAIYEESPIGGLHYMDISITKGALTFTKHSADASGNWNLYGFDLIRIED